MENERADSSLMETDVFAEIQKINKLKDVHAILDQTLASARSLTGADAGTIFLVEGERLTFAYVHNDTLYAKDKSPPELYGEYSVPINGESIVGFSAMTKTPVSIDDVYNMPPEAPYHFNKDFDKLTGYRTKSVLTIPLADQMGTCEGVLQLINAKNGSGKTGIFAKESVSVLTPVMAGATLAIERGRMTHEMILRMMKMAELRDPKETGAHVRRVGGYVAEIYNQWALDHAIPQETLVKTKDMLRIASMLHDVGKVGVADSILKKPGKLTEEEYDTMKWHTIFGARLFGSAKSELDEMCRDIALNHHEKWDGKGYPGRIPGLFDAVMPQVLGKANDEIPLPARLTALADVFDALSSRRSYKEPWSDERILETIKEDSGKSFDPEVVEAFFKVLDVCYAIRAKYREADVAENKPGSTA